MKTHQMDECEYEHLHPQDVANKAAEVVNELRADNICPGTALELSIVAATMVVKACPDLSIFDMLNMIQEVFPAIEIDEVDSNTPIAVMAVNMSPGGEA